MFEEASRCHLVLSLRNNHIIENGGHGEEALSCLTKMTQARIVEQNLLNDKRGDGLAELGAAFHYSQAQWDDLRLK